MDEQTGRRGVLVGALGLGATALSGCVRRLDGPLPAVAPLPKGELDATLERLDLVVGAIQRSAPNPRQYGVADGEHVTEGHALMAKGIAAMHVMGTFGELPEQTQLQPEVQRRMWRALPEVHQATMAMTDWLESLDAEKRRRIDQRVRSDDELPMRIVERLDADARRHGVSIGQRAKLRALATHVSWRLRNQGAGPLVDELVGKIDRVVARQGADAELQRAVAVKIAEAQLFGTSIDAPTPASAPGGARSPSVAVAAQEPYTTEPRPRRSTKVFTASAILWGCTLVAGAMGGILIAVGSGQGGSITGGQGSGAIMGGAIALTVAGLLMLAAIITLIVAAAIAAGED